MSLFNENLKKITLKELCSLIIILFLIQFLINSLTNVKINSFWICIFIIFYFAYKLRHSYLSFKEEIYNLFSTIPFNTIFWIVLLNIFLSYGFLYLSDFILDAFPNLNSLMNVSLSSIYLNNSIIALGGFIVTVFISPISEELIFRGVLLNRLKLVVPTIFSLFVTSLLFASMHSFGSIVSAFIFALCMGILYIKTENIFVPMFAHFLNNFLAQLIVFVDVNEMLFTNNFIIVIMSLLAVVSFVIVSLSILKEVNFIK